MDDQRVARGLGINVGGIFALTFAFGSGFAGLGGALGTEILGLDPTFPLKYMIYFLIVVTVGGTSSITGPFLASLLLGIADVAGKYYVPKLGPFVIYTIMIIVLIWRPQGLFTRAAVPMSRTGRPSSATLAADLAARARWHPLEIVFWAARFRRDLAVSEQAPDPDGDRLARPVRAVARSHPRLRRHHLARPCRLLRLRRLCGGAPCQAWHRQRAGARAAGGRNAASALLGFATSFLVLRGSDLTRLMVSLGVALILRELANQFSGLTGGADGLQGVTMQPILGLFRFDMFGHNGYVYCLARAVRVVPAGAGA